MKSMTFNYWIAIFCVFFWACGGEEAANTVTEEEPPVQEVEEKVNVQPLLQGHWELEEIRRSGNVADMGKFYIDYDANGQFTSNLFNAQQKFPFENGVKAILNGYSLQFENLPDTFHIEMIDDQNLVMSTVLQNGANDFLFEYYFAKKEATPQ